MMNQVQAGACIQGTLGSSCALQLARHCYVPSCVSLTLPGVQAR